MFTGCILVMVGHRLLVIVTDLGEDLTTSLSTQVLWGSFQQDDEARGVLRRPEERRWQLWQRGGEPLPLLESGHLQGEEPVHRGQDLRDRRRLVRLRLLCLAHWQDDRLPARLEDARVGSGQEVPSCAHL